MNLPIFYVDEIIINALKEDVNYVDVASDYLIPEDQRNEAYFVAKADGVLRFEKLGKDRKQACVYPAE